MPWLGCKRLLEVMDYIITPGVYSPCVIDLMMNLKTWQRLSAQEKQAVSRAALNTVRWAASQKRA